MTRLPSLPAAPSLLPPSPRGKIVELRALLSEKFPSHRAAKSQSVASKSGTPLDDLPRGAVAEFVGSLGSGSLYLAALLHAASRAGLFAAVIDGGRSFDPHDWPSAVLDRVLWILCEDAPQTVKAADLLLRDGNLPLLILDLQALPPRQLTRFPASTWHRFHRIAEQTSVAMVVLTPRPLVEGAHVRIASGAHGPSPPCAADGARFWRNSI